MTIEDDIQTTQSTSVFQTSEQYVLSSVQELGRIWDQIRAFQNTSSIDTQRSSFENILEKISALRQHIWDWSLHHTISPEQFSQLQERIQSMIGKLQGAVEAASPTIQAQQEKGKKFLHYIHQRITQLQTTQSASSSPQAADISMQTACPPPHYVEILSGDEPMRTMLRYLEYPANLMRTCKAIQESVKTRFNRDVVVYNIERIISSKHFSLASAPGACRTFPSLVLKCIWEQFREYEHLPEYHTDLGIAKIAILSALSDGVRLKEILASMPQALQSSPALLTFKAQAAGMDLADLRTKTPMDAGIQILKLFNDDPDIFLLALQANIYLSDCSRNDREAFFIKDRTSVKFLIGNIFATGHLRRLVCMSDWFIPAPQEFLSGSTVLRLASDALKDNPLIVSAAILQDPRALEFASPELRDNEQIVDLAFVRDPRASRFASHRLQIAYRNMLMASKAHNNKWAAELYRLAAEQGVARAQNSLGLRFENGRGVNQDYTEASRLFQLAAEQGDFSAQFNLGRMFEKGLGVTQNNEEATQWYRRAAEQGMPEAQFKLALMFELGCGVTQNDEAAAEWYRRAAEQGLAEAQYNLGVMFENGHGVIQNDEAAAKWYKRAAEQGMPEAQFNLGVMLESGRGVTQNDIAAAEWYRRAAEQGLVEAQVNLGLMYEEGRGVTQNDDIAAEWYRRAAEHGVT